MAGVALHEAAWSSSHCKHWALHNWKLIKACQKTQEPQRGFCAADFYDWLSAFSFPHSSALVTRSTEGVESLNTDWLTRVVTGRPKWEQNTWGSGRCSERRSINLKFNRQFDVPDTEQAEQGITWVSTGVLRGKEKYDLEGQLWSAHHRTGTEVSRRGSQ